MDAGFGQSRLLGLGQGLCPKGVEAAGVFQPRAEAEPEEFGRQFIVLGVGGFGMFGVGGRAMGFFYRGFQR